MIPANNFQDREEALKDDFQFDSGTYGYDESDDEWDDEEANWNGPEQEEQEPAGDAKDESTAYLEFLNEEVSIPVEISPTPHPARLPLTAGSVSQTC